MDYKELRYLYNNKLSNTEPRRDLIFKVFETHPEDIKVVILNSCPYPNLGMATGLALENGWNNTEENLIKGTKKKDIVPKELQIIEESITRNYEYKGIESWTQQGVFLFNTALTVERGKPNSHNTYWRKFTERIINHISQVKGNKVWLIWGSDMKQFCHHITNPFDVKGYNESNIDKIPMYYNKNYVIIGGKPITEYYGSGSFHNRNFFKFTNIILQKSGVSKIEW